ncbi:hypothetical protein CKAH01_11797 [Colletotrichum kahawae]|uniref:Uncharacterized protein n=1 Tax=Colletotrichum kahawae TaxID=34407 RepID=A0AAD9YW54_COLKA|nr:hypothetical protein CKAH01_11797 [Colletotrichum kahawae]
MPSDEQALRGIILRGDIFGIFSHAERLAAFAKLCSFDFPMPSLSTFFKDFGYLERCGNSMKHLVPMERRGTTVRRMLLQSFNPSILPAQPESLLLDEFDDIEAQFQLAMRRLWLFAMSEFHSIRTDPSLLPRFGSLAFDNDKIRSLKELSPHREIARQAMALVRSSQDQDYDSVADEAIIGQIAQAFSGHPHGPKRQTYSAFTTNATTAKMHVRPWLDSKAYLMDRPNLVVEVLDQQPIVKKKEVTSLFLLRSIYKAIFHEDITYQAGRSRAEPSHSENHQHVRNHRTKESRDHAATRHADSTVTLDSTNTRTRRVRLQITQAGINCDERYVDINLDDENEPNRIGSVIQQLMVQYRVLPFSPMGYPLLAEECYGEIVRKGRDCLYLTDDKRGKIPI